MIILYTRMMQKKLVKGRDYPSIARLLVMMVSLGLYLGISHWANDLETITLLIILSCVFGFAIGYSSLSKVEVFLSSILISIMVIFPFLGLTLRGQLSFFDRVFYVLFQLGQSIYQLFHHLPIESTLFFLFSVTSCCWFIGFFSGFSLVRSNNPWSAIFFGTAGLIAIDVFLPKQNKSWFLTAMFFLFLLFLMARIFFNNRESIWKKNNIVYEPNSKLDFNRNVILNSILIIFLAWTIPSIVNAFKPGTVEQQQVRKYFEDLTKRWNNVFAPLNQPEETSFINNESFFSIGQSIPTDDQVLLYIESSLPPPNGYNFYWRSRVYDYYDGEEWSNSDFSLLPYTTSTIINDIVQTEPSTVVTLSIRSAKKIGIFFTNGNILSVDLPGELLYFNQPDSYKDVIAVIPNKPIEQNQKYSFETRLNFPSSEQLIVSGSSYPDWVKERYLQLPENLPQRVIDLALEITAGVHNPFDKTLAITEYLRGNIQYESNVPSIPEGRDLVDWLLFDQKKGFCTYYASAEVILLRSLGIPARFVVGYAQGERLATGTQFRARLKDSHAWPEVWFEGIGWVEFEPTVTILPLGYQLADRNLVITTPIPDEPGNSQGPDAVNPAGGETNANSVNSEESTEQGKLIGYLILLVTVIILASIFIWQRQARKKHKQRSIPSLIVHLMQKLDIAIPGWISNWVHREELTPIQRIFENVMHSAKKINLSVSPSQTPQEKIDSLVQELPMVEHSGRILLFEYERDLYSTSSADRTKAENSAKIIQRMILEKRIQNFFKHSKRGSR
jgi:transglutaminase-like putative cysteine protease